MTIDWVDSGKDGMIIGSWLLIMITWQYNDYDFINNECIDCAVKKS